MPSMCSLEWWWANLKGVWIALNSAHETCTDLAREKSYCTTLIRSCIMDEGQAILCLRSYILV